MDVRQPIVAVLGHVDHGKTTLLDYIRGSGVADREAGKITQHIGATEVPVDTILNICGDLLKSGNLNIPGLLFIDTPGHHSFITLRKRGGALADIAILMMDIIEGIKPQTIESINILKQNKTPFIVALNKLDRIQSWREHPNTPFLESLADQNQQTRDLLDERIYKIIGKLYERGFSAERYDRVSDFTRNIGLIPISAKTGEGIPDLLMTLVGLTQRYMQDQLCRSEGCAEGTVLELKEVKGLGKTIDVIIYEGILKKGQTLVIGTSNEPLVTRIKALLQPKALDEIRDPREKFTIVDKVVAAAGIKITAPDLEGVIAGAPFRSANPDNLDQMIEEVRSQTDFEVNLQEEGVFIKADAIGSLEALAFELDNADIPIKRAEIGDISRRDVIDANTAQEPLHKVILGFNVKMLPDAEAELDQDTKTFMSDIVYKIMEDYQAWREKRCFELESCRRSEIVHPGKFKVLDGCVFRVSKPAVVGVRILAGRIRSGQGILKEDGRVIGTIKSIQTDGKSATEALAGSEVAVSIDKVTVGRQFDVEDVLYVDIPESDARTLFKKGELNPDEEEVLEMIRNIKRNDSPFWGM